MNKEAINVQRKHALFVIESEINQGSFSLIDLVEDYLNCFTSKEESLLIIDELVERLESRLMVVEKFNK